MNGSGKVLVLKRDGGKEPFDALKLSASLLRVIQPVGGTLRQANDLAGAIELYLTRSNMDGISSTALFEMALKVLRRVGFAKSAQTLEGHHFWRAMQRVQCSVRHDTGQATLFDKGWLASFASRSWYVSQSVARIVAGQLENELLEMVPIELSRGDLVEMLNNRMAAFGLADAVPVAST